MAICSAMSYTPYATYLMEQTFNIITFPQFQEGYLLSESRDNMESGDDSDDDSTVPPLISEE